MTKANQFSSFTPMMAITRELVETSIELAKGRINFTWEQEIKQSQSKVDKWMEFDRSEIE